MRSTSLEAVANKPSEKGVTAIENAAAKQAPEAWRNGQLPSLATRLPNPVALHLPEYQIARVDAHRLDFDFDFHFSFSFRSSMDFISSAWS